MTARPPCDWSTAAIWTSCSPQCRPPSPGAGFALHLSDVFGETDPATGKVLRPPAAARLPATEYQIGSMDAVGRLERVG